MTRLPFPRLPPTRRRRSRPARPAALRGKLPESSLAACLLIVGLWTVPSQLAAQQDEPLESPRATVSQVVGLEPITVVYHSPGVKDRKIWGELVPYGQNWRAGANDKTTIRFEEQVKVGDTPLEAGTYGLYIVPHSATKWTVVLNQSSVGSPNEFDPKLDVVRVDVTPVEAPFRERLRYSIDNFSDWPPYTAELVMHWEKIQIVVPLALTRTK